MRKSLVTAAVVLSLASGAAFAEGDKSMRKGPPPHVQEALAKLPEDRAALIQETLREMHEGKKEHWQQIKTLREEMKAILTAENFDKAAYLAKAKEIHQIRGEKMMKKTEKLADLAKQLSPEERKVLADILPGGKKHYGKPKHGQKRQGSPAEAEGEAQE